MDVRVILPNLAITTEPLKTFDTAKDVLARLTEKYPENERKRYRLYEVKQVGNVPVERLLDATTNVAALRKDWESEQKGMLKLVKVDNEIIVNFNIYFRMTAGKSETRASFFVSSDTLVSQLNTEILSYLSLPKDEKRFGLMGNYDNKQELRKLSKDEKVVNLKTAWENSTNTFFQFQVLPEAENQLHLGADKEGFMEIKTTLLWSRRWFSLRGTSLFSFKEKGDREPMEEVEQVNLLKISEIGQEKKKALLGALSGAKATWRFDLNSEAKVIQLSCEDEGSMKSWIEAIKSSGSRQVSRDASVAVPSSAKRTLIPISDNASEMAKRLQETTKVAEQKKEEANMDDMLENIKLKGKSLVTSRGRDAVEKTKDMVTCIQEFISKAQLLIGPGASSNRKNNVIANASQAKDKLKEVVTAAKAVATQTSSAEITPEVRKLMTLVEELNSTCEFLVLAVRMEDEADFVPASAPKPAPTSPPALRVASGNAFLDSAVNGLNMFGVAPELMELMQQAAAMPPPQEDDTAVANTTANTTSGYSYGTEDAGLDDILSNLTSAMNDLGVDGFETGLDLSQPAKQRTSMPVRPVVDGLMETCSSCYGLVEGTSIKAFKKDYHPHCFFCSQCAKTFTAIDVERKQVVETPTGLLCRNDWLNTLPKCPVCIRPVEPQEGVFASNSTYHAVCFKCTDCKAAVQPPGCYDQGTLLCEICLHRRMGSLCSVCQKPIYGKSLVILEKKRHPECLLCNYCKKTLTKETARVRNERVYCIEHANALF